MNNSPRQRYSQPGLEPAYSDAPEVTQSTDPEVVRQPHETWPIPVYEPVNEPSFVPYKGEGGGTPFSDASSSTPPAYNGPYGDDGVFNAEQGKRKPDASRRKLFILIGALVAIAVIVGAVVGGVLGSKASAGSKSAQTTGSPQSSESTSAPSPSSSASAQVNTTAVRPNTRLSVTGRRIAGDGFTSRLFWQGGDNKIRAAAYGSTSGKWETPLVFDGTADAKPGTPIAATIYLLFPQFELFYLDGTSTFRGVNFGDDETVPKVDSVNTDRPAFAVQEASRMAAYWPYVIYQNDDAKFRREVYDSHNGLNWFNDSMQGWFNSAVTPLGDNGTGMALVPVVKEYKGPYAAGIAYRDQDGRLSIFSFGGVDTGVSWNSGTCAVLPT